MLHLDRERQYLSDQHQDWGAECIDVLTGFKWIAAQMDRFEKEGKQFIFAFEESYGFNALNEVRDKDAIGSVALCAEMALYCASKGMSLLDYLYSLYEEYGYFEEIQISATFKGQKGLASMNRLMDDLRNQPLRSLGNQAVVEVKDYLRQTATDLKTQNRSTLTLPQSNVLQFILDDDTIFSIRPSGTEPKVKFYVSCSTAAHTPLEEAKRLVSKKMVAIKERVHEILKEYE